MNNTSSRPSKLQLHTMENSISCNRSEIDQTSLIKMCFEMCTTLKETGSKFSFALKLDSGFNFSLTSGGVPGSSPKAKTKRHRSGSYLRRQARRRAAFLERKKKHLLEEEVTTTRQDNSVCVEEAGDVLNKNTAFSVQTYAKEDETVEGDRPLDLNPKPHYPEESVVDNNCSLNLDPGPTWFQRKHTEESLESENETEMSQEADDSSCREQYAADKGWAQEAAATDQGDQGDHWITVSHRRRRQTSTQEDAQVRSDDHWRPGPLSSPGYAQKSRKCDHTRCQGVIDDHTYRPWPTYCRECLEEWIHECVHK